jgi:hypothetical protein
MLDETKHRNSGKLCTKSAGHEMVWNGHLVEGANLTSIRDWNFCLWTRCGQHDVPSNSAHRGDIRDVVCTECKAVWNEENGQFGVGA